MSGDAMVREVRREDVDAVVALVARVLGEFGLEFGNGCATDTELSGLPEAYRDAGGAFWVAVGADGVLLGTCGVFPVEPGVLELRKMYVLSETRGTGLGGVLLERAVAFARETGATAMVLDTANAMERAIAFYERHGFVRDDAQIRGARCDRGYYLAL
jgi:putative acetyltransferase